MLATAKKDRRHYSQTSVEPERRALGQKCSACFVLSIFVPRQSVLKDYESEFVRASSRAYKS